MSILFRIALAIGLLASGVEAAAQSRFPVPDRPVAPVISPEYSGERTRDGHGEAERVMNHMGITRGQRVADIGAGYGYYTVRLARRLGPGATITRRTSTLSTFASSSPGSGERGSAG
jgi:predicted methyltransferase